MHELSIAGAIVDTATRHADGRPVALVSVRIGPLRQIVPDSLRFYFEIVARGGACENASLTLTQVALLLRCRDCGLEWEPAEPEFRCPRCGHGSVEILTGEELEIDYIEVEEEAACIGPE